MYKDKGGKFRWRLEAANGKELGMSVHGYEDKSDCKHAVEVIMKGAAKAKVTEEYPEKPATLATWSTWSATSETVTCGAGLAAFHALMAASRCSGRPLSSDLARASAGPVAALLFWVDQILIYCASSP